RAEASDTTGAAIGLDHDLIDGLLGLLLQLALVDGALAVFALFDERRVDAEVLREAWSLHTSLMEHLADDATSLLSVGPTALLGRLDGGLASLILGLHELSLQRLGPLGGLTETL